ncbi:acyltransferase family protein [Paenibacillus mucilaginosus]|uniref:Acyltransferase 3 domain-containing protein n=1 Tax=Paenibacillus mucilaginosus (strain KNP414) TaxID=1036673 RepID=F8FME3_PAEMK|nr:acyltransferase family protein [Paenibacillus mucilaginosus]AEI40026.1 hypothetical protein KNP414_01462 [Paenibacillus mucilaginosus KNP414]MCG7216442.1 acyltransferase family protein [Paenibacillus mucilaginosus]WDM29274.1 acyltransferase family protein [Paenibacillus mucilaginosus]
MSGKKLSYEILLLRCIGCLFVAAVHAVIMTYRIHDPIPNELYRLALNSIRTICSVGTPIFIFITEFLIAKNYKEDLPKQFISKRLKVLIPPYIAMGIIGSLYKVQESGQPFTAYNLGMQSLKNIFLADYNGYFIVIIIQFILIHYLFHYKLKLWPAKIVLPASFLVNFVYLAFFNFVPPFGFSESTGNYIWYYLSWMPFFGWAFYFALGYYCGKHYDKFIETLNRRKWLILAAPLFFGAVLLGTKMLGIPKVNTSKTIWYLFFMPSVTFVIFYLSSKLKSVPNFVVSISDHSFGIYLTHAVIMRVFVLLYKPHFADAPAIVTFVLIYVTCVGLAMAVTNVLNKVPFGKYLVGPVRDNAKAVRKQQGLDAPSVATAAK